MRRFTASCSPVVVVLLAACTSSPPTIAIECVNLAASMPGATTAPPIKVGDPIACSITLRNVPSEGESEAPSRVFQESEWAFTSGDGGLIHPQASKTITGWFAGDTVNVVPEQAEDVLTTACRASAEGNRNATPVELSQCEFQCCGTPSPGAYNYDFVTTTECRRRSGRPQELNNCKLRESTVHCILPYQYPSGAPREFSEFVAGQCQLATQDTCAEAQGRWGPNTSTCFCCRLPSDQFHSSRELFTDGCVALGGVTVGQENCWYRYEPCGWDQTCSVGFCKDTVGGGVLSDEADCARTGGRLATQHADQTIVCCQDNDTREVFVRPAPTRQKRHWRGTTSFVFTAIADGTVTVSMRQTSSGPLAFVEASPGSSTATVQVGAPLPMEPSCNMSSDCTAYCAPKCPNATHPPYCEVGGHKCYCGC